MKQVDFIQLLAANLKNTFTTDELLQVLVEQAYPEQEPNEIRKLMYNHLYRLEDQQFVERMSKKRMRNGKYRMLSSFSLEKTDIEKKTLPLQSAFSFTSDDTKKIINHQKKLIKEKHNIEKKLTLFSNFTEMYNSFSPLIQEKLTLLNEQLIDQKIELEVIDELLLNIKNINASEVLRTSPV